MAQKFVMAPRRAPDAGTAPPITISGGQHAKVAPVVQGNYVAEGENHGKPVYAKQESVPSLPDVTVRMYYWDERDGPAQCGWWFGPEVGADTVWGYNGTGKEEKLPPTTGWQVPWNSEPDPTLVVKFQDTAASGTSASGGSPAKEGKGGKDGWGSWGNPGKGGTKDEWSAAGKGGKNDWSKAGKTGKDEWAGVGKGKNDWAGAGKGGHDQWASAGKGGKNEWAGACKGGKDQWAGDQWSGGGKGKQDEWADAGMSGDDQWSGAAKGGKDEWAGAGKAGASKGGKDEWGNAGKGSKDEWGCAGKGGKSQWAGAGKAGKDEWASAGKGGKDEWAEAGKGGKGEWAGAGKGGKDEWAGAGKGGKTQWAAAAKGGKDEWAGAGKGGTDEWGKAGQAGKDEWSEWGKGGKAAANEWGEDAWEADEGQQGDGGDAVWGNAWDASGDDWGSKACKGGKGGKAAMVQDAAALWATEDEEGEEAKHQEELEKQSEEEELERQKAEELQRQQELEKKRQEEELERKRKEEELERRKAEEMKRKQEEEERRKESAAALTIRKAIAQFRVSTPETFESLKQELETSLLENADALGSQAEKVFLDAEQAVLAAEDRVRQMSAQQEADSAKKKDGEDRVRMLVQEVTDLMTIAAEKVVTAAGVTKSLAPDGELGDAGSAEEILEAVKASAEAVTEAKTMLDNTSKVLYDKANTLGDQEPEQLKTEIRPLFSKLALDRRSLAVVQTINKTATRRANRKAAAAKREAELKELFLKYDKDGDELLNRGEVVAYAEAQIGMTLKDEDVDRIYVQLGLTPGSGDGVGDSVTPALFAKFRSAVSAAKTWERERRVREKREEEERQRRAEQEKKKAERAARREKVREALTAVATVLREAEESIAAADISAKKCRSLRTQKAPWADGDGSPDVLEQLKEVAGKVTDSVNSATEALANLEKRSAELTEVESTMPWHDEVEEKEELKEVSKLKKEVSDKLAQVRKRAPLLKGRVDTNLDAVQVAKSHISRQTYTELNALWLSVARGILKQMQESPSKTADEVFAKACDGDVGISQAAFEAFVESLPGKEGSGEEEEEAEKRTGKQAAKLFLHLAGDGEVVNKDQFQDLTKMYYKVVKATVLTDEQSLSSKSRVRLQDDECLELLEGPTRESGNGLLRIRCRRLVDQEAEGWATVVGNQGTPFLQPCSRFLVCAAETPITSEMSPSSEELRKLSKGEAIEVFQRADGRVKGKALSDGTIGWASHTPTVQVFGAGSKTSGVTFFELS